MSTFDDPEEFVGTTQERKAEPKSKRTDAVKASAPVASPHPGTAMAVYTKPAEGESHPKHAVLGPAQRLNDAEVALNAATLELQSARHELANAEMVEAAALDALNVLLPGPTFDEVNRKRLANEQAIKLDRVKRGLLPLEPKKIVARSPVDLAAAQRPRTSPIVANQSLRSPVVRRQV